MSGSLRCLGSQTSALPYLARIGMETEARGVDVVPQDEEGVRQATRILVPTSAQSTGGLYVEHGCLGCRHIEYPGETDMADTLEQKWPCKPTPNKGVKGCMLDLTHWVVGRHISLFYGGNCHTLPRPSDDSSQRTRSPLPIV